MEAKHSVNSSVEKSLLIGYNQTYIILNRQASSSEIEASSNEVLFRCGNWCYRGLVQFNELKLVLKEIPIIIPALQKQQGALRYYCTSKR
jgi:hypothetical protein